MLGATWRILFIIFLTSNRKHINQALDIESQPDFGVFMGELQNPCINFYGYACGNWRGSLEERTGEFRYIENYLKQQHNQLLAAGFEKRMHEGANETNAVNRKAQDFYNSCRNTFDFKVFQYVDILRTRNADFNWLEILHNSNFILSTENWNLLSTLGLLRSYGFNNALLSMTVTRTKSTRSQVKIHKPSVIEFDSQEQIAIESLEPELKSKLIQFKQKLISAAGERGLTNSTDEDKTFMTKIMLSYLTRLPMTLPRDKFQLTIEDMAYMHALQTAINETPPNVVAYFVGLKFVSYLRDQLPKTSEIIDCLDPIRNQMPELLNFIYSEQLYDKIQREKTDKILNEVFRRLKIQFRKMFTKNSANLDDAAMQFMKEKLLAMQLNVGQIPLNVRMDFYENYFREFRTERENLDSFYRNHLNAMRFRVSKQLEVMSLEANDPNYLFNGYKNAPILDVFANVLIYPFSLLRKPIFDEDEDELFHYAGIGSIIAHDMAHGFDTNGLKIDSKGNPSNLFVETLNRNEHIQKALQCFRKQTSSRLDEKIADFVGSRIAYDAYFENTGQENLEIPSNMTRKQIYFVKFSQFYCVTDFQSMSDEPKKWLSQIVENNEDFYRAFNCSRPQNHEACELW